MLCLILTLINLNLQQNKMSQVNGIVVTATVEIIITISKVKIGTTIKHYLNQL